MKEKLLFKNKWIDVYELDESYTIYRLGESNKGVAILVYKFDEDGILHVLMRRENVPPHGNFCYTSITGTVEKGEDPLVTAIKELKEETGYVRDKSDLIQLGYIYPSKASDFVLYLYAVDVGDTEPEGPILGDGGLGEQGATTEWHNSYDAVYFSSSGPSISTCILRLATIL